VNPDLQDRADAIHTPDYLKGHVVVDNDRPEMSHRDAMHPWKQAMTDDLEMEKRLALSCLEGTSYHKAMPALSK
jgi:hypothetical protein